MLFRKSTAILYIDDQSITRRILKMLTQINIRMKTEYAVWQPDKQRRPTWFPRDFTVLVNDKVISTWTQQLCVQRTLKLCQCSRSSPPWMRDISSLYKIFVWHPGLPSGFISLKWSFHRRNVTINLFLGVFHDDNRQLIPASKIDKDLVFTFQDSMFSLVMPITRWKWLLTTLKNLT